MFCDFFRERGVEAVYRDVTLIRRHHWLEGGPLMRKSRTFLELYPSIAVTARKSERVTSIFNSSKPSE